MIMSSSLRLWPSFLLAAVVLLAHPARTFAHDNSIHDQTSSRSFAGRERDVFRPPVQNARFAAVPHWAARASCESTHPPEALATPMPHFPGLDQDEPLVVSFIVGTDGKVHSALVLQGGDDWSDRLVLQVVRHWRYRPATCNGVPTESEAKVQFSHP